MEQMEWREAVEEAREAAEVSELEELHRRLLGHAREVRGHLAAQLDETTTTKPRPTPCAG
jgi:molecular chaperone HscB